MRNRLCLGCRQWTRLISWGKTSERVFHFQGTVSDNPIESGFWKTQREHSISARIDFLILFVRGNDQAVYIFDDWLFMSNVNVHDDMASILSFRAFETALAIIGILCGPHSDPCQVLWAGEGPISLVRPWSWPQSCQTVDQYIYSHDWPVFDGTKTRNIVHNAICRWGSGSPSSWFDDRHHMYDRAHVRAYQKRAVVGAVGFHSFWKLCCLP